MKEILAVARSGKIHILKRDGTIEPFDLYKLRGSLLRVLPAEEGNVLRAEAMAAAVRCYLLQRGLQCASSAAILEMVLTALRLMGWHGAAARLEQRHIARSALRSRLALQYHDGRLTAWSKEWLVQHARSHWLLGRTAARILAGQVEQHLLDRGARQVDRRTIMKALEWLVGAYGLATPVPAEAAGRPL